MISYDLVMNSSVSKQEAWDAVERRARAVTDKLGRPIDAGILETVIALRLLGINTTVSCEGHLGRVTGGPYVTFESEEAMKYAERARLLHKAPSDVNRKYNRLRKKAAYHSTLEVQKLLPYLDKFYAGRETPYANRLIIRIFPMTHNCLKCQGAELAYAGDEKTQQRILLENQTEMRDFTDFLKASYFTEKLL